METFTEMSSLQTIWTAMSGHDHVPVLAGSLFVYGLSFILCLILQRLCKLILPHRLYPYAADFSVTLLLCGYPYSHGSVRMIYGHAGYVIAAVVTLTVSLMVFEGMPSPLRVFVCYLKGEESLLSLMVRAVLQLVAAFLSYRLVFFIWSLELTTEHQMLLQKGCETDLNVPVILGFLVEFSAVFYDTWLCHQQLFKSSFVDTVVKNINGALLVCAGVHLTGMYMHPALATAMSFNCKGTNTLEHIAVYWIASFLGSFAGVQLNSVLRLPSSGEAVADRKKRDGVAHGRRDVGQTLRSSSNNVKHRKSTGSVKAANNNNIKLSKKHRKG